MTPAIIRQIINRLVMLAVCLTPLFYLPRFAMINALNDSKWHLLHVIGALLVAMWGAYLMTGGGTRPGLKLGKPGPAHLALLAYGGLMIVSALASGEVEFSLTACIIPVYFLVMSFTPILMKWSADEISRLLRYVFVTGTLLALTAMWQTVHSESFFKVIPYQLPYNEARISMLGTIGNPEYMGTYLAPILLLAAPWLMRGALGRRLAVGAGAAVIGLVLLLTTARGAAMGFALGGIVTLILARRIGWWRLGARAWGVLGAGAAVVLALAIIFSFPNRLNVKGWEILPRFAKIVDVQSDSIYERIVFYSIGAEIISQDPVFGAGEGMFGVRFYPTLLSMSARDEGVAIDMALDYMNNRVATKAHNDYLEVWAENGTPAFLALLLAIVLTLRGGWLAIAADWKKRINVQVIDKGNEGSKSEIRNPKSEILMLSLYPAFVCMLIFSIFSFPIQMPSRGALFWVMWGCLAQAMALRERELRIKSDV